MKNLTKIFIATRYNVLYYCSQTLAEVATLFAYLSALTVTVPRVSDALELISKGFLGWGEDIHDLAVEVTLPHAWKVILEEKNENPQVTED